MKTFFKLLVVSILLLCGIHSHALGLKWTHPGNGQFTNLTLYGTYSAYTNVPWANTNLIITTDISSTNPPVSTTNNGIIIPSIIDPTNGFVTNWTAYSFYVSKLIRFEVAQYTDVVAATWSVNVNSNRTEVPFLFPGTNTFTVSAIHTNLTSGGTIYSIPSFPTKYPTPTDEVYFHKLETPNTFSIAFMPKYNHFYTVLSSGNLVTWTNMFPFEVQTNQPLWYYKEFTSVSPFAFYRAVSYPDTNYVAGTNPPVIPLVVTNSPLAVNAFVGVKGITSTTNTLSGTTSNTLFILTTACETALQNSTVTSIPALTWNKIADANGTSSGDAEMWAATTTTNGKISVITTWGSGKVVSSVLYAITGQETTLFKNDVITLKQSLPTATLTTTKTNSIIIGVKSDWNGVSGTQTFVGTPIVQTLTDLIASKYQANHWYKTNSAIVTTTQGNSAPSGQSASTILYEIRQK